MSFSRSSLIASAQSLCDDFAAKKDLETVLSHFSTVYQPTAIEHGEPLLAPFLGRPFVGLPQIRAYFELLKAHLTYEDMNFSEYMADVESSKVCVKGRAKFEWLKTKQTWDETFVYVLCFDHQGKITDYQVWADSGAAYLADIGELTARRVAVQK